MEPLWLIVVGLAACAFNALILAWPMSQAVHYLARVKPLFWPTYKASFLAMVLGLGAVACCYIPVRWIFRLGSGSLSTILVWALFLYFHAALFRRYLQTTAGTRINLWHSLIVSLIPMVLFACVGWRQKPKVAKPSEKVTCILPWHRMFDPEINPHFIGGRVGDCQIIASRNEVFKGAVTPSFKAPVRFPKNGQQKGATLPTASWGETTRPIASSAG